MRIRINQKQVKKTMKDADIPAASIACVSNNQVTDKMVLAAEGSGDPLSAEAMFGAASLSKPVFAYLVLQLINKEQKESGSLSLETKLNDILPFDEFCEKTGFKFDQSVTGDVLKNVTIRSILSHTSGLNLPNNRPIESEFKPGSQYSYSNLGIYYLQKVIEEHFKSDLQTLAHENVFGPKALDMKNSCYYRSYDLGLISDEKRERQKIYLQESKTGLKYEVIGLDGALKKGTIPWEKLPTGFPRTAADICASEKKEDFLKVVLNQTSGEGYTSCKEPVAPNSLFTTAHDYAVFVNAWMNSKDELLQEAFKPIIFMTTDDWAKGLKVPKEDLEKVAWGLGWGLETNDKGDVVRAYHTADMNNWRAQVVINLEDKENKTAIVYLANSKNGHILSDQIIKPNVDLEHGFNYFFQKYGFARQIEPNWQAKEDVRMSEIGSFLNSRNTVKTQLASINERSQQSSTQAQKEPVIIAPEISTTNYVKDRVSVINRTDAKEREAKKRELSGCANMHKKLGVTKSAPRVHEAEKRTAESDVAKKSEPRESEPKKSVSDRVSQIEARSGKKSHSSPKPPGYSTKLTRDPNKE